MCNDLALAQQICNELNKGNAHAILELIERYGNDFEKYANMMVKKTYFRHMTHFCTSETSEENEVVKPAEDVLQDFWLKKIIDEKVVCKFEGRRGSSLKTFLKKVLYYFIMGYGKKAERLREDFDDLNFSGIHEKSSELPPQEDDILSHVQNEGPLDEACQQILIKRFVNTALERLSVNKSKDAKLIFLRMKGLSYRDIALLLAGVSQSTTDRKYIDRQEGALRKQCTRKDTGSYVRFSLLFNHVLKENGYSFCMIDNIPKLEKLKAGKIVK